MKILHQTRTLPALLPRYVERFRCIGAECEDTCCRGWAVTIDKKTFKAYREVKHPELRSNVVKSLSHQHSQATPDNYARIKLDSESGACPFTQQGLCSVQKNLNESYLSHTCFSFPRHSRNFGGQYEQALSLSCPEAARQALLSRDAFDFTEELITVRMEKVGKVGSVHGVSLELMNEIRILCLKLVKTEDLVLWERLAVLGLFCECLTELLTKGKQAEIPSLLANTVTLIEQGDIKTTLSSMQPDYRSQAVVFASLWSGAGFAANSAIQKSPVQEAIVKAISRGLGADPETGHASHDQIVEAYMTGLKRLPEALKVAPFLLEHFVLNEMFRDLFPFKGNSPYEAFLQLISQFGLLRLMLAAQCNSGDTLPDETVLVHTAHVFYRRFQHDLRFAQVNQALKNSGLGKLEKVYGFLRT
ncbi:flagellin lysine-N-methylase [Massilia sp.]|uniref:flagellin lysine-N-methylase n=1 Tax=Massilia sp. TaxID=1882437 RepID=UPI00289DA2E2|nr:flagellin lysine-N-methylase [Massilia sp.]